jgi:hypothetical protein
MKIIFCYIDPGTGSYVYQIIIASVTGVIFYLSSFKKKIKVLFRKINNRKKNN